MLFEIFPTRDPPQKGEAGVFTVCAVQVKLRTFS